MNIDLDELRRRLGLESWKARAELAEADSVRTAEALIDMRRRAEAAEARAAELVERVERADTQVAIATHQHEMVAFLERDRDLWMARAEAAEARVKDLEAAYNILGDSAERLRNEGRAAERAAIVEWLRGPGYDDRADEIAAAIESGAHIKEGE